MKVKLYTVISVVSALVGIYNAILYNMGAIDVAFLFLVALTLYYIEKDFLSARRCINMKPDVCSDV